MQETRSGRLPPRPAHVPRSAPTHRGRPQVSTTRPQRRHRHHPRHPPGARGDLRGEDSSYGHPASPDGCRAARRWARQWPARTRTAPVGGPR
ncbi:hypothetical protein QJS66_03750 [Kocuria rhizophila]|nr:hypothetical protein QJS66_03750 [Kocuria rhizophila]